MPILGPPEAFSPAEWGAQIDYDSWRDLYSLDDGVVLHHGGSSDYSAAHPPYSTTKEAALLRSWERFHLRKGWRGLAYGWGVGQSGAIYRIRGWGRYGAHLGDVDGDGIANNDELIPIIWIASGNHHTVSDAAHRSITRLREWFLETTPADQFYGHREVYVPGHTQCPGPNGMTYVNANRDLEDTLALTQQEQKALSTFLKNLKDVNSGVNFPLYMIPWFRRLSGLTPAQLAELEESDEIAALEERINELGGGDHHHDGRYVKNVIVSR